MGERNMVGGKKINEILQKSMHRRTPLLEILFLDEINVLKVFVWKSTFSLQERFTYFFKLLEEVLFLSEIYHLFQLKRNHEWHEWLVEHQISILKSQC